MLQNEITMKRNTISCEQILAQNIVACHHAPSSSDHRLNPNTINRHDVLPVHRPTITTLGFPATLPAANKVHWLQAARWFLAHHVFRASRNWLENTRRADRQGNVSVDVENVPAVSRRTVCVVVTAKTWRSMAVQGFVNSHANTASVSIQKVVSRSEILQPIRARRWASNAKKRPHSTAKMTKASRMTEGEKSFSLVPPKKVIVTPTVWEE